jgi:hypothetical protein
LGYLLKMFGIRKKRDQTIPLSFVQWMEIARKAESIGSAFTFET